jgi:hypothetical protein
MCDANQTRSPAGQFAHHDFDRFRRVGQSADQHTRVSTTAHQRAENAARNWLITNDLRQQLFGNLGNLPFFLDNAAGGLLGTSEQCDDRVADSATSLRAVGGFDGGSSVSQTRGAWPARGWQRMAIGVFMMTKNASQQPTNNDQVIPEQLDTEAANQTVDAAPDPFDPESLKLGQDFAGTAAVKKVLTTVRCRKPNRHEFVRVRSGDPWRLETAVFEDKVNRETYLVDRAMWSELGEEVSPVCLFLAVNRQGDVFLWPAKLPRGDGRSNSWNDSALAAAELAQRVWIRLSANMPAGLYDVYQAQGELSDPEWPELTFPEILKLSFKDRYIRDPDHPILRQLRGES